MDTRPRSERLADDHKECLDCQEWLPLDAFSLNKNGFNGRNAYCKGCASKKQTARLKDQYRAHWTNRLLMNIRTAYAGGKRRQKVLSWAPSDITEEYLYELFAAQKGRCGWTGVALSLEETNKPWSVSLDRIDCDQGYVRGNVMLTCLSANFAHNAFAGEDMRAFIQMIKEERS